MNPKPIFRVLLICAMLLFFGCAHAGTYTSGSYNAPDGTVFDTQASQDPNTWAQDGMSMNVYHTKSVYNERTKKYEPQTSLVTSATGFSDGLMKKTTVATVPAVLGGATQGAFIWWAAKVLRPDQTNVNAGNNSGNMSQGQKQGQAQKQKQGQAQGQSQKTDTKVSNTNVNANTNLNTNKNTAQGGAGGSSTNINTNLNTNKNTAQGGAGGAGGSVNAGDGGIGNINAGNNANINTGAITNTGAGYIEQGQH